MCVLLTWECSVSMSYIEFGLLKDEQYVILTIDQLMNNQFMKVLINTCFQKY